MASQSAGNPSQPLHLTDSTNDGDGGLVVGMDVELGAGGAVTDPGQPTVSPLTFGKIYSDGRATMR